MTEREFYSSDEVELLRKLSNKSQKIWFEKALAEAVKDLNPVDEDDWEPLSDQELIAVFRNCSDMKEYNRKLRELGYRIHG